MRIFRPTERSALQPWLDHLAARSVALDADLMKLVASIINDVRIRGDEALIDYTARFDRVELKKSELRISRDDLQRYSEAISAFHHISGGGSIEHSFLAAAYTLADDMDNAHRQSALTLSADSAFSVKGVGSYLPYIDQAALDRYLNAMRMAGLPE